MKMMSDVAIRSMMKNPDHGEDLGVLRMQQQEERERELARLRSGSAPPTVEGSLTAFGGLFSGSPAGSFGGGRGFGSEEELRADPAYANYYYSNANLNPRLPPPLVSKEDWRFAQRFKGGAKVGGIGDRRRVNGGRGCDDGVDGKEESAVRQRKNAAEWGGDDGLIGLPALGLGNRQRSIAELFQDEMNSAASASKHPHHLPSNNVFDDIAEKSETHFDYLHRELDAVRSGGNMQGISGAQNLVGSASQTYASALGGSLSRSSTPALGASLSRSSTPDSQLLPRAASPCLPPIGNGRSSSAEKRNSNGQNQNSFNAVSSNLNEPADLVSALASMNLSQNDAIDNEKHPLSPRHNESDYNHNVKQQPYLDKPDSLPFQRHSATQPYLKVSKSSGFGLDMNNSSLYANEQLELHKASGISVNSHLKGPSTPTFHSRGSSPAHYHNVDDMNILYPNYGMTGYAVNPSSPPMMANQLGNGNFSPIFEQAAASAALGLNAMDSRGLGRGATLGSLLAVTELQNANRLGNHAAGSTHQLPLMDPLYLQYLRSGDVAAAQIAALNESALNSTNNSFTDLAGLQKAYVESLLAPQKSHFSVPYLGKSASLNHNSYGNPSYGPAMSYPGSPLAGSLFPNTVYAPGSPMSQSERNMRLSGMRNVAGGFMGAWHSDTVGSMDANFQSSLLDEFKSNKTKCFELSEIAGHVVEFSADQYGSRFIQQKLETASMEEKNMVFHEIMPHALSLMTDVFGNYVIQKFFEHGTAAQIRELADQLTGHVLTLSLQMYGCRVIQKFINSIVNHTVVASGHYRGKIFCTLVCSCPLVWPNPGSPELF
ncbi:Pumilio RNA-binding repeat [Sesbania bispinosa]|nr:Pumilio RNA-binding repeat [Sesbania bispinosa]